jgi:hypothetical protein
MNAIVRDADFLDALKRSPAGEKIAEQQAREQLARRREAADQLSALDAHEAAEWPRLTSKLEAAIEAVKNAERALIAVRNAAAQAQNDRSAMCHGANIRRSELQRELRASAHPAIAVFRLEMHGALDTAHKALDVVSETWVNQGAAKTEGRSANNLESIKRHTAAVMAAMDAADALALFPDQGDIPARLDELRRALPPIERPVLPPREEPK